MSSGSGSVRDATKPAKAIGAAMDVVGHGIARPVRRTAILFCTQHGQGMLRPVTIDARARRNARRSPASARPRWAMLAAGRSPRGGSTAPALTPAAFNRKDPYGGFTVEGP